jgi:SAM-dependent methyltransferase
MPPSVQAVILLGAVEEDYWEKSKSLWRIWGPTTALTWGQEVSGEAFVSQAQSYGAYGPEKAVLEVGPGYGRLLRECVNRELAFRRYVGVDISPQNVESLSKEFDRPDVEFVLDDIETVSLDERFDSVLSSLTFKHLYPSFERALQNICRHLNPLATVIFDLMPEGQGSAFHEIDSEPVAYSRHYRRSDVEEILERVQLELVGFDEVHHSPEQVRLLVVARKPA